MKKSTSLISNKEKSLIKKNIKKYKKIYNREKNNVGKKGGPSEKQTWGNTWGCLIWNNTDEDKNYHKKPNTIFSTGRHAWYEKNKKHREDGPSIIQNDTSYSWYFHDEKHRIDGPAHYCKKLEKFEYKEHGKYHRIGGFAIIQLKDKKINNKIYEKNIHNQYYVLFVNDVFCKNEEDYIKECQKYCLREKSAHDTIEIMQNLENLYKKGALNHNNWKDNRFIPPQT